MKNMNPIAMKCSEEQFNQIKPILQENGVIVTGISSFKHYPYLTNNLDDVLGRVSNTFEDNKSKCNRAVFEEWDQEIFLQHCGIETKPKFIPIAMKCSEEQFNQIKPILEEYGLYSRGIDPFDDYPYLINNLGDDSGNISNATDECKTKWDREVFEEWDQDIFLQYCGFNIKQNKENMKMVYIRSVQDMMKIYNVACDTWKHKILKDFILKVNPRDGMIEVTEKQIDAMFNAATPAQVPVLEEVFGKQKKEIEWSKIKTGSKVMIKDTGQQCGGFHNIDKSEPVDVVFWKTPHIIQGDGEFCATGAYPSYCTFHQNGNYVLFSSHENTDYVIDVVEY